MASYKKAWYVRPGDGLVVMPRHGVRRARCAMNSNGSGGSIVLHHESWTVWSCGMDDWCAMCHVMRALGLLWKMNVR